MSRRARGAQPFRNVDLTPLVDVMLVLLIVFMITAPLLSSGLPVDLPNVTAEPAPVTDTRFVVSVTADERIYFGERDVTESLESVLLNDTALRKASEIYIRADENARYKVVARVVAAARRAGVAGLNLVVEHEEP